VRAQENPPQAVPDESALVEKLRSGDESAFATLVDMYSAAMRRLALAFVRTGAVADEVVQEAWLGVVRGIDRFEGRSSVKTWIFRILVNVAKTRGQREARSVPFSSLESELAADEPSVDPSRFSPKDAPSYPEHWTSPPYQWQELPEERLLASETRAVIDEAVAALPTNQRLVITLRDIEGSPSEEVCNVLEISETNQRVLLHRARSKVRQALEDYLSEAAA
jgi:RNA polymerase sigma-70 factor, ECF subfamily